MVARVERSRALQSPQGSAGVWISDVPDTCLCTSLYNMLFLSNDAKWLDFASYQGITWC